MSEPLPYARGGPPAGNSNVLMTFVSAAIFLYFGFSGLEGASTSATYNYSIAAFVWSARVIGAGLAVVGVMLLARLPGTATLDLLLSAAATLMCFGLGGIWIAHSDSDGLLLLLFGLLNASSTRAAWYAWRARRAGHAPPAGTE